MNARLTSLLLAGGLVLALVTGPALLSSPAFAAEATSKQVQDARHKIRQQDLTGALKHLEAALAEDPADPDANLLYQDTAAKLLGLAEVETRYRGLAAEHPESALFQYLAARLLAPAQAVTRFEKLKTEFKTSPWPSVGRARALEELGKIDASLTALDEAIALATEKTRFRAFRAATLERAGRWSTAITTWQQVTEADPKDAAAFIGLGEALRGAGQFDQAIQAFAQAAALQPGDAEPHYRMGIAHLDAGRFAEAVKAQEQALVHDRNMVEALCAASEALLASATAGAGDLSKPFDEKTMADAEKHASKAVTINPDSARAHFALGAVLEVAGEEDDGKMRSAAEEYSAVLSVYTFPGPERVRGLVARAYVNLRLGRFPEALEDAERAINIDAQHATAKLHAAHALMGSELFDEAIKKYLRPGAKTFKDDARFAHAMGMAHWSLGEFKDAKKQMQAAVKFEPENGLYRLALGELHYSQRENKDAVKQLFEATELRPWDVAAWRAYGRACTSEKHWKEAVEAFEKTVALDAEAVEEHIYIAIIMADQLKDTEGAKDHIQKFRDKGGSDPNLEAWMDRILES